jgi:hypothetical protein
MKIIVDLRYKSKPVEIDTSLATIILEENTSGKVGR